MISIEITNANNEEYIGQYLFQKNLIKFGANILSEIYLPDEKLNQSHIFIEVIDDNILIHLQKDAEFFFINGKRTTTYKFLKRNDLVKIGDCTFKLLDYKFQEVVSMRDILNKNSQIIKNTKPELLRIIQELSK